MQSMTEEEARTVMKAHGWYFKEYSPRGKAKYISAKRRQGPKVVDCYICPLSRLSALTKDELVAKLTARLTEISSAEREPEVSDTTDPLTHTDEP